MTELNFTAANQTKVLFRCENFLDFTAENFLDFTTIALSFVCVKYCLIIN